MNWQELSALLVLATAMSFSPGPNTTLSTTLAANFGLRRALPFVFAVPVGWGLLLGLCALGVGALVLAVPLLGWAVKAVGVVYLLLLASQLARSRTLSGVAADRLTVSFWRGVALQFVNIKAWLLALSIVGGWVVGRADAGLRFAVVLPVMLSFALGSNLAYALLGSLLREWLAGPGDALNGSGESVTTGSGGAARRLFEANSPAIGEKNNAADGPGPVVHPPQGVNQSVPKGTARRLLAFNRLMALVLAVTAVWMLFI